MIDSRETAENAAEKIEQAAAKASNTFCSVRGIELANARDAFWLVIEIGLYQYGLHQREWYTQIGDKRETNYAHIMRIRVPETVLQDDTEYSEVKLKRIGESLADIWDESRYFPRLRQDRKYVIPHIDPTYIKHKS